MFKRWIFFIVGVLLSSLSPIVTANDTSIGLENGAIIFLKQPDITMEHEKLFISFDLIKVDYIFKNNSDQPISIPMAFPMPALIFDESGDISNVKDFRVFSNGSEIIPFQTRVVLLDKQENITPKLADLGWSIQNIIELLRSSSEELRETTEKLPAEWFTEKGAPRFTVHEYYLWKQDFPAKQSIKISHSYSPSSGGGVNNILGTLHRMYDDIEDNYVLYDPDGFDETFHCLQEPNNARFKEAAYLEYWWADLRYILTTANNWRGPIKNFHLTIQTERPDMEVAICFDGKLTKTSRRTYEFHAKNFIPTRDLNIIFLWPEHKD